MIELTQTERDAFEFATHDFVYSQEAPRLTQSCIKLSQDAIMFANKLVEARQETNRLRAELRRAIEELPNLSPHDSNSHRMNLIHRDRLVRVLDGVE